MKETLRIEKRYASMHNNNNIENIIEEGGSCRIHVEITQKRESEIEMLRIEGQWRRRQDLWKNNGKRHE